MTDNTSYRTQQIEIELWCVERQNTVYFNSFLKYGVQVTAILHHGALMPLYLCVFDDLRQYAMVLLRISLELIGNVYSEIAYIPSCHIMAKITDQT